MLIIPLIIASLVLLSLVIDTIWRRRLTAAIRIEIVSGKTNTETLIVYLPGILASAHTSSIDLIETWRRYGDVMLVEYGIERFSEPGSAQAVTEAIRGHNVGNTYNHISFIGASMGGLLAHDIIHLLKLENTVSIELIVLDAPTSSDDFQGYRRLVAPLLNILLFGPIWNRFDLISRLSDHSKVYKLSFWRDQLAYIMRHGKPGSGSLTGLVDRLIYVRSTRDHDTVRPAAAGVWLATTPSSRIIEVDSTHVGFAESPQVWQTAFVAILKVKRDRVDQVIA